MTTKRNPHEQTGATQKLHVFATQAIALIRVIKAMVSPLKEESQDLLRLLNGYHGQAVNSLSYYNTIKSIVLYFPKIPFQFPTISFITWTFPCRKRIRTHGLYYSPRVIQNPRQT